MRYQGIIFDLDGVICTTDHYHYLAWKALADRLGIPFNEKDNNRLRGVSRMASLEIILEKSDKAYTQEEKEAMATEKNDTYRQLRRSVPGGQVHPGPAPRPGLQAGHRFRQQEHPLHPGAPGPGQLL